MSCSQKETSTVYVCVPWGARHPLVPHGTPWDPVIRTNNKCNYYPECIQYAALTKKWQQESCNENSTKQKQIQKFEKGKQNNKTKVNCGKRTQRTELTLPHTSRASRTKLARALLVNQPTWLTRELVPGNGTFGKFFLKVTENFTQTYWKMYHCFLFC